MMPVKCCSGNWTSCLWYSIRSQALLGTLVLPSLLGSHTATDPSLPVFSNR
jgi:hypothetical protein